MHRSGPMPPPAPSNGHLIEVPVHRLQQGMYVAHLDRPWLETSFRVQGFYIRDEGDLEQLRRLCSHVYVDPRRVEPFDFSADRHAAPVPTPRRAVMVPEPARLDAGAPEQLRRTAVYQDRVSMREEFQTATKELKTVTGLVVRIFDRLRQSKGLDAEVVERAVNPIIESVLRNKDAMAALVRMKHKDDYTYSHSISTAVWATILGRHLGFGRDHLQLLAISCALLDIGKLGLPRPLLVKPGPLTRSEMALVRRHVGKGVKLLRQAHDLDSRIVDIVAAHHERHDGSGYPLGLVGTAIPLGARIAGLVDSYDAMTTARPYAELRSSYQAMQELAREKDARFQGELVEQLMQAVGLFPTGSLVELNTGEVGIVVAQNRSRRLKPKIVIVLRPDKARCRDFPIVDLLAAENEGGGASPPRIVRELPAGAYGIDAEDYYL
jgi:HD-GYP domain-containing protein (c-di-GMP phosphodiesterase class II)